MSKKVTVLIMADGKQICTKEIKQGFEFPMYIQLKQSPEGIQVGFHPLMPFSDKEILCEINSQHIMAKYEAEEAIAEAYNDQVERVRQQKRLIDSGIILAKPSDIKRGGGVTPLNRIVKG